MKKIVRRRRGAAAIEFAMWLPILAVMFSGIMDVSWLMSRTRNVTRAARDGARVGISVFEDEDVMRGSEIAVVAEEHATAILEGVGMTCDARCDVTATVIEVDGVELLEVEVLYDYQPLIGMIPLVDRMESHFTMMLQQQSTL